MLPDLGDALGGAGLLLGSTVQTLSMAPPRSFQNHIQVGVGKFQILLSRKKLGLHDGPLLSFFFTALLPSHFWPIPIFYEENDDEVEDVQPVCGTGWHRGLAWEEALHWVAPL